MDTLKACTTNVHVINEIGTTPFRQYVCEQPAISATQHVARTIANLREQNLICVARGDQIWLFGVEEKDSDEYLSVGFRLEMQGTFGEQLQASSIEDAPILTAFLEALQGYISHALLCAYAAVKIAEWTWYLPENEEHTAGVVARTRYNFSDECKKLTLVTNVRNFNLATMGQASAPVEISLAPNGLHAVLRPERSSGPTQEDQPDEGTVRFADEEWRSLVCEELASQGLKIPGGVAWVNVVPSGMFQAVSWPALLCLPQRDCDQNDSDAKIDSTDWQHWFQHASAQPASDPLSFAEEWFGTSSHREQDINADDVLENGDLAMDDAVNSHVGNGHTAFDVTSPIANRPDLQALHGIYPTPPDGLAIQSATQTQIQSDNISAPSGDAGTQPGFTPSDPPVEGNPSLFDDGAPIDAHPAQRNHSIVSSVGPQAQDWTRGSPDDLFGDMDDGEYGRDEVDDADFNFFDEPDHDDPKADSGNNGLDTSDVLSSMTEHLGPASKDEQNLLDGGTKDQVQPINTPRTQAKDVTDHVEDQGVQLESSRTKSPARQVENQLAPNKGEEKSSPNLRPKVDMLKPLSPFGIREALLPPPIPASVLHGHQGNGNERRKSGFGPLTFNPAGFSAVQSSNLDYADFKPDDQVLKYESAPTKVPFGMLAESPESPVSSNSFVDTDLDDELESVNGADDSTSMMSYYPRIEGAKAEEDAAFPTRKRKRTLETSAYCGPQSNGTSNAEQSEQNSSRLNASDDTQKGDMRTVLSTLLKKAATEEPAELLSTAKHDQVTPQTVTEFPPDGSEIDMFSPALGATVQPGVQAYSDTDCPDVMLTFPWLSMEEIVILSQMAADQAVTVTKFIERPDLFMGPSESNQESQLLKELAEAFKLGFPTSNTCDIPSLALVREPLQFPRPQPPQTAVSTPSQARHPPRPPPRADTATLGPDILPLNTSHVRIRRGEGMWEMVATSLSFWESLGLAPVSGGKDTRHFCIAPDSSTLALAVSGFLHDLKAMYECCKFGSMAIGSEALGEITAQSADIDAITSVTSDGASELSMMSVFQAYEQASAALGTELASIALDDPGRTLVVSIIDPFDLTSGEAWVRTKQNFSACFLRLSKAYHAAIAQHAKKRGIPVSPGSMSDVDFKILPISLIASPSGLVISTAQRLAPLAREIYDRCPPSLKEIDDSSSLPNIAAPSVELVAPLPKRVSFQLASDPPKDLLHEGSVLHVAYALSADGEWVNVAWHDNTGRYAKNNCFGLRGRSFAEVALEIWVRTTQLIKAREVIWRVFIVATGSNGIETSCANCWKDIIAQHTDRKQLLSVSLLHFQASLTLSIVPPVETVAPPGQGTASGAPTPVATPQPASGQGGSTNSPDTNGAGNAALTAPPTPAPSEAASSIVESDPEAHLIETEDETWGMLLDRDVAATIQPTRKWIESPNLAQQHDYVEALSHGLLVKRGKINNTSDGSRGGRPFPCAATSLIWTLRVRPKNERQGIHGEKAIVDEGHARHAEVMLREVMGMFRNLALLSKVKGLDPTGLVPVHVLTAVQGAEGLNGLLRGRV
ncbi:hypothetical protein WHR41_07262 [Cladosporium halotolerans]|uniref:Mediator of RNA polymerase II transcription subunit 13 n=1 Tax=Cladosporium halotolerans TaxID=1052096 RepID=A0AB34KLF3_9PEZI